MKIKLLYAMLAGAALLGATACNSNDEPNGGYELICNDFVTFEGNADGKSTFTFRREGDSPLITLTSSQQLQANLYKPDTRIIISYAPQSGKQYTSGPVTLLAAMNVEGRGEEVKTATAATTKNWESEEINVASIVRSGDYLNVQFTAALGSQTPVTNLYVDQNTIGSECPELHLIFGPFPGVTTTTYVVYGSRSIADIWNRPETKSIKVLYKNAGGAVGGSVTIVKDSGGWIKPTPEEA